jgi:hypothetical protein
LEYCLEYDVMVETKLTLFGMSYQFAGVGVPTPKT